MCGPVAGYLNPMSHRKTARRAVATAILTYGGLTHSTSYKNEVRREHYRENVREPADLATPPAESLDDGVADKSERESVGN